jgi:hypothetical protein
MRSCADIAPLLGPLADGALPDDDRAFVEDHLRGCASCRDRLALIKAQGQALREALGARAEAMDLSGLSDRVMARVREDRARGGERAQVLGRELWWAHPRAFTAAGGLALAACLALAIILTPSRSDDVGMLADNSPLVEEVDFGTRGGAVLQLPRQTTVIWMSDDRAAAVSGPLFLLDCAALRRRMPASPSGGSRSPCGPSPPPTIPRSRRAWIPSSRRSRRRSRASRRSSASAASG